MRIRNMILALLISLPLLGGCWDTVDISRQNYAMTVALNGSHNNISCLLQCADPISPEGASGDTETGSVSVNGYGTDISTALGNATQNSSKTITYEHLQLILLGEEIYKSCAAESMQYFVRSADVQKNVSIVISDGNIPKMLDTRPSGEPFYDYVKGLLSSDLPSESKHISGSSLLSVCRRNKDGHPYFINKIRFDEENEAVYPDGIGVFCGNTYIGAVSANDWENSRWFEETNGDFYINCSVDGYNADVGFRCVSTNCIIDAVESNGGFSFTANIDAKFVLSEYLGNSSEVLDNEFYDTAETALESMVLERCTYIVDIAQSELKTDFLGFSFAAESVSADWWEENNNNWNSVFVNSKIKYNICCSVLSNGDAR